MLQIFLYGIVAEDGETVTRSTSDFLRQRVLEFFYGRRTIEAGDVVRSVKQMDGHRVRKGVVLGIL